MTGLVKKKLEEVVKYPTDTGSEISNGTRGIYGNS